jgi:hypothetical protein
MSAVARGIAEADSVGNAANAQVATPISNKRFIFTVSLEPHHRGQRGNVPGTNEFHFLSRGMPTSIQALSIPTNGYMAHDSQKRNSHLSNGIQDLHAGARQRGLTYEGLIEIPSSHRTAVD